MKRTDLRLANGSIASYIRNSIKLNKEEIPKYVENLKQTVPALHQRVQDVNKWYTRIIGLDEVRVCQDRVVALQERLLAAQEKRRSIGQQLAEVRKKSNDLQDQIHKVKRQENLQKFLDLMREETEILKLEQEITHTFGECDREEREVFSAFTNAVRDSHEKQRAQLEYTKYFGIILSIVGSLLTFCYSTIKKRDLRKCIEENIAKVSHVSGETYQEGSRTAIWPFGSKNPTDELVKNIVRNVSTPVLREIEKQGKEIKELRNVVVKNTNGADMKDELHRTQKQIDEIRTVLALNKSFQIGNDRDFREISGAKVVYVGLGLIVSYILLKSVLG